MSTARLRHGRRTTTLLTLVAGAALAAACGGGEKQGAGDTTAATTPPPAADTTAAMGGAAGGAAGATTGAAAGAAGGAGAAVTGKTVDVKMMLDGSTYKFDPANVTIHPGDGVRWTMVSGGPHNVSFWPDSIPAGMQSMLQANMQRQMSPLVGPLLTAPNETYTISFANAKPGVYKYYCTPHLAMGMKAQITVQ